MGGNRHEKRKKIETVRKTLKVLELENELQKTKEAYGIEEKETLLQKSQGGIITCSTAEKSGW